MNPFLHFQCYTAACEQYFISLKEDIAKEKRMTVKLYIESNSENNKE